MSGTGSAADPKARKCLKLGLTAEHALTYVYVYAVTQVRSLSIHSATGTQPSTQQSSVEQSPVGMAPLAFTDQLRASSSSLHGVSDALVVAKLMVAFTDRRVYGLALGSFYHVYLAIERLLYENKSTAGTAWHDPGLCMPYHMVTGHST